MMHSFLRRRNGDTSHSNLLGASVRPLFRLLIGCAFLLHGKSTAQAVTTERTVALELGGASNWDQHTADWNVGPHVAVEFTPIEGKLAIEVGTTRLSGYRSTDWGTDLLIKKPWNLSSKAELMIGAGPEWIRTTERRIVTNSVGAEVLLDFMYWPSARHAFGWFIEPSYDYSFGRGHSHTLSLTAGILISIRSRQSSRSQPRI